MNLSGNREGSLKGIFDALEETFQELDIDFYLISALARDVWYEKAKVAVTATKDVDLAVMVSDEDDFERLKAHLKDHKGFHNEEKDPFRMHAPDGSQVDILPFGSIETDGTVQLKDGFTSIAVEGFTEVYN